MTDELKPCPFCGLMAIPCADDREYVGCSSAECPAFADGSSSWFPKYWNTRPIESALAARVSELERELAELRETGELTGERIAALWTKLDASSYHSTVNDIVALVRRCVAIDRASRPAPKWVVTGSLESDELKDRGWWTANKMFLSRPQLSLLCPPHLFCPPIPPPSQEEKP